ncbi:hypothetical protein BOTBODRAFT_160423 [Botryobasidium botryosum FD-172 SS1]|uniref:Serine/threonine-protein phosphatase 2A activator n=1 Tax=Botryobasidium botryosum (strain FD-172 SS1) TaxID=930990 RepID=A0A067MPI2_BOTB1|nr:hypothetical protein BOTBODRAFT_160423 [Botryobasidium botryosum FD-172 SS1]
MAGERSLPPLPHILLSSLPHPLVPPRPQIKSEDDVHAWHRTRGYHNYGLFLRRLNESVVGHDLGEDSESEGHSEAVDRTITMLALLESWVDDIPPRPTPQRFGNLAFRDWGKRLEEQAETILQNLLPPDLQDTVPLLTPYFLTSFGSFTRIDYGSGHELSFALFMMCLTLLRFFQPTPREERHLVLRVFERYLRVIFKLQDVYKLEPAGSHGVWGLDDFHFLPYLWGSAQVRDHPTLQPSSVLRPPLPPTNLYNIAISRIFTTKYGPFHEHSSQLHSIASSVPHWRKVNQGMIKMYEAEVLAKRVVVQHVPMGGLLEWDVEAGSVTATARENENGAVGVARTSRPNAHTGSAPLGSTQAPWATSSTLHTAAPGLLGGLRHTSSPAPLNALPPLRMSHRAGNRANAGIVQPGFPNSTIPNASGAKMGPPPDLSHSK